MNEVPRKLISEAMGTALLLVAIVGSGISAERLATDSPALALFVHSTVVGLALIALILTFGATSAHFNPAVSLFFTIKGELSWSQLPLFVLAQVGGAVLGVVLTHAMFDHTLLNVGATARTGSPIWLSEVLCTLSLLVVIVGASRQSLLAVAVAVGTFIGGALWCFSSIAFANPAVTIARCLTDTYTAIRPIDVGPFIVSQLIGAGLALLIPVGKPPGQRQQNP